MVLREIERELAVFAESFDSARVDVHAARDVVERASRIAKMASALVAQAAARVEDCFGFDRGAKSPAHDLARLTGSSLGQAIDALTTGRRMEEQPELAAAALKGEVSLQQAAAISGALAANPKADPRSLLEAAAKASLTELRNECDRIKAAADPDAEERRRRIHNSRLMRRVKHGDGSAGIVVRDNPERIAQLYAGLAGERERLFREARAEGRVERSEALDLDALMATVAGNGSVMTGRAAAKVLVRVDFAALFRGYPVDGELCEIAGYGPVAVSAVKELLAGGNAFLVGVVTNGEQVTGVAHLGRKATAAQRSALEWIEPTCARLGCSELRVQIDHRHDWADTEITMLEWLDGLCVHDHYLKTHKGWALVEGVGKRELVPPEDPRHPNHSPPKAA